MQLDLNVILDFGFWSRAEREDYRARAAALGAGSELHFVDAAHDLLLERLAVRFTESVPDTLRVTPAQLADWSAVFERPTAEELVPRAQPPAAS